MAQRTRRVAIALRRPGRSSRGSDEIELTDDDVLEVGPASSLGDFALASESPLEVTSFEVDLEGLGDQALRATEPPPPLTWRGAPRVGLGKETLQVLAPLMVKQLARPASPPPRFPRSASTLMAAAAVAGVLLSASAALAWA